MWNIFNSLFDNASEGLLKFLTTLQENKNPPPTFIARGFELR
jgi:hypothetical protein